MKKFLTALVVAFMSFTVAVSTAEARRLGGGGSFGKSSPTFSRQATPQGPNQMAPAQRPAQPGAPAPKPASPWKGILGGALLGLGLGALLSHFGLGGELAGMISTLLMVMLLAFAAMFIFRMIARRNEPRPAFAGPMERSLTPDRVTAPEIGSGLAGSPQPLDSRLDASPAVPADFDVPAFLRHAKTNFIRMQAAWDRADVSDIREFTTPEMFAELKMQLTERGASANQTDVVSIDAEMLGVESNSIEHVASVRFTGMIREEEHAPAQNFSEVWVLTKSLAGSQGWLLAGIQQT